MLYEHRQIGLDRTPNHTVAHLQVFVSEQIPEVDDLPSFRNSSEELWIPLSDHFEGFADNGEFPFHGRTDQAGSGVRGFVNGTGGLLDGCRRLQDVA